MFEKPPYAKKLECIGMTFLISSGFGIYAQISDISFKNGFMTYIAVLLSIAVMAKEDHQRPSAWYRNGVLETPNRGFRWYQIPIFWIGCTSLMAFVTVFNVIQGYPIYRGGYEVFLKLIS